MKNFLQGGKPPLHPPLRSLFWKILGWGKKMIKFKGGGKKYKKSEKYIPLKYRKRIYVEWGQKISLTMKQFLLKVCSMYVCLVFIMTNKGQESYLKESV